jgi:2'-5' RNA ligase
MHRHMKLLAALAFGVAALLGNTAASNAQQSPATAIDIALEPDDTMLQHAKTDNARLRQDFPKGFSLDETHSPHVTLLQRYVRTADLDKVYDATGKVLASENFASWKLKAFKYYYIPNGPTGLAGIVAEPTDDLLRLQTKLIEAVRPYTVETGTAAAFVTTPEEPDVNEPTIAYIAGFVPQATGAKFNPHVTIGVGTIAYLEKMLAEPFGTFAFSPAGASIYQLGNFGTARKKLKTFQSSCPQGGVCK